MADQRDVMSGAASVESLCGSCAAVREVVSGTGSTFLLCTLSQTDARFPKYPPQPVLRCDGYTAKKVPRISYCLEVLAGGFAIFRLEPDSDLPDWATGDFISVTRTPAELSVLCHQDNLPAHIPADTGWRCLRVCGVLDLSMVGVIASLSGVLAAAHISVFVVGTFQTDHLFVKETDLSRAVSSLRVAGHEVR